VLVKSDHCNDYKTVSVNCLLTALRAVHGQRKDGRTIAAVDTNRAWRLTVVNTSRIDGLVHKML